MNRNEIIGWGILLIGLLMIVVFILDKSLDDSFLFTVIIFIFFMLGRLHIKLGEIEANKR